MGRDVVRGVLAVALAAALALGGCGPAPAGTGPGAGATETSAPPTAEASPTLPPEPTVTLQPTPTLPPTMAPVALPEEPPDSREAFRAAVGNYLAAGGDVEDLRERLEAWGAFAEAMGGLWVDADLNGDGHQDLVISARDVAPDTPQAIVPWGVLLVYLGSGAAYTETLYVSPGPEDGLPVIQALADLTSDGQDDVLYATTFCGAHTCYSTLQGYRWSGTNAHALFVDPLTQTYPGYTVEDLDGDGTREVIVEVGTIGSVGAGPQRLFEQVYAWDGEHYVFVEQTVNSPQHPIHLINDGDALVVQGDYSGAVELYRRSYTDPDLDRTTWEGPEGWEKGLEAYARYREVYAWALAGDREAAEAAYEALQEALGDDLDAAVFVGLAEAFWGAYSPASDLVAGCEAVREAAAALNWPGVVLNAFGYANRTYAAEDMCALGQRSE